MCTLLSTCLRKWVVGECRNSLFDFMSKPPHQHIRVSLRTICPEKRAHENIPPLPTTSKLQMLKNGAAESSLSRVTRNTPVLCQTNHLHQWPLPPFSLLFPLHLHPGRLQAVELLTWLRRILCVATERPSRFPLFVPNVWSHLSVKQEDLGSLSPLGLFRYFRELHFSLSGCLDWAAAPPRASWSGGAGAEAVGPICCRLEGHPLLMGPRALVTPQIFSPGRRIASKK